MYHHFPELYTLVYCVLSTDCHDGICLYSTRGNRLQPGYPRYQSRDATQARKRISSVLVTWYFNRCCDVPPAGLKNEPQYVPLKLRWTSTGILGVTIQKLNTVHIHLSENLKSNIVFAFIFKRILRKHSFISFIYCRYLLTQLLMELSPT